MRKSGKTLALLKMIERQGWQDGTDGKPAGKVMGSEEAVKAYERGYEIGRKARQKLLAP